MNEGCCHRRDGVAANCAAPGSVALLDYTFKLFALSLVGFRLSGHRVGV
jgi:hypothetical protein